MRLRANLFRICNFSVLLLVVIGCQSAEKKRQLEHQATVKAKAAEVWGYFDSRYHPVIDWQNQLQDGSYSIDAEKVFIRADHRPLLFFASLDDIKNEQGVINLYMTTTPTHREPILSLVLTCQNSDLDYLRGQRQKYGDFEVVAEPVRVDKSLEQSDYSPDYVVHGNFLDARWISDYAIDIALHNANRK